MMIIYHSVSIIYDHRALLQDFSLEVPRSRKVVFYGPSGSGKSSLLMMLPGFTRPDSGTVSVNGLTVNESHVDAIREKIAWVPQEAALPFTYVKELIDAPFLFKANKEQKPEKDQVLDYFEQLGLDSAHYDKRISEISGGEQQRIMLLIAALLDKPVILLDEPTSALDSASIDKVITFFRRMEHTTILAVSHDERFIRSFDQQIKIGGDE
ncbi:MAG: ATP-binding cassette domain-containing protein [Bacteroidales bacterium]|jgi:polar amino acid transport system ATP-binding protein/putative ABC transport system ATP-binding protein|nr:ATP-binding cassette domain-containing protein [Bacteroidales bacterium]